MVESASYVCGSVRDGGKEPKVCVEERRDKNAVRSWKRVLAARDEETKERCMKAHRDQKRKAKRK